MTEIFNGIINSIAENWLSQSFALLSILLFAISYLIKKKAPLFVFQTAGNLAVGFSFLFLGDIVGALSTSVATVRSGVFTAYSVRKKEIPWWLVILFVIITLATTLFESFTPIKLMYCVGLSLFTLSMKFKDILVMKICFLISNILYLIYSYMVANYVNALGKVIQLVSIIVGIIIILADRKKNPVEE